MPEEKNMDIKLSGGNSRAWRKKERREPSKAGGTQMCIRAASDTETWPNSQAPLF